MPCGGSPGVPETAPGPEAGRAASVAPAGTASVSVLCFHTPPTPSPNALIRGRTILVLMVFSPPRSRGRASLGLPSVQHGLRLKLARRGRER